MANEMMRIAIVVPRYGEGLGAGAESEARGFAEEAVRQGWHVEIWTSCAQSHYSWENELPAGQSELNGVCVRRFPISGWSPGRRAELEMVLAANGKLPVPDQYAWLAAGPQSAPLYDHVARHAGRFDAVIVLPYLMSISYYAAWARPENVILWPCLHDEAYAYMEPVRLLMESVRGVMFNSPEEGQLAVERMGMSLQRHAVLGAGVTLPETTAATGDDQPPYLLYIGRLEEGKNLPLLYEYMLRYAGRGNELRLVMLGKGPFRPPDHPAFDYRGYVSDEAKAAACAGALALCQPSLNESFSFTMMEGWLAGRPALVHRECAVTQGHVQRSKGGLYFRTFHEFAGALDWFQANPAPAARMGTNGRAYVRRNYTWPAVAHRFGLILQQWAA